jgi:hypothetical protein
MWNTGEAGIEWRQGGTNDPRGELGGEQGALFIATNGMRWHRPVDGVGFDSSRWIQDEMKRGQDDLLLTSSNTTEEDTGELTIPSVPVGQYELNVFLAVNHAAAAGSKFLMKFDNSGVHASSLIGSAASSPGAVTASYYAIDNTSGTFAGMTITPGGSATSSIYQLKGYMNVTTQGDLKVQAAQNTSSATPIAVKGYMTLKQVR